MHTAMYIVHKLGTKCPIINVDDTYCPRQWQYLEPDAINKSCAFECTITSVLMLCLYSSIASKVYVKLPYH